MILTLHRSKSCYSVKLLKWGGTGNLSIPVAFLAHLIRRMQMCYWYQKLEISKKSASNVRNSASNVQNSLSEPIRELYIWGQLQNRPQMYRIWRFNLFSHMICLSQSENRICTFEAEFCTFEADLRENLPQMYRLASNVHTFEANFRTFEADQTLPGPRAIRSLGQSH